MKHLRCGCFRSELLEETLSNSVLVGDVVGQFLLFRVHTIQRLGNFLQIRTKKGAKQDRDVLIGPRFLFGGIHRLAFFCSLLPAAL
jgi:hypothetical protein